MKQQILHRRILDIMNCWNRKVFHMREQAKAPSAEQILNGLLQVTVQVPELLQQNDTIW